MTTHTGLNDVTNRAANDYFIQVVLPWIQGVDEVRFPHQFYDTIPTAGNHYLGQSCESLDSFQKSQLMKFALLLSWQTLTPKYLADIRDALQRVAIWTDPAVPDLAHCIPGSIVGLGSFTPRLIREIPQGVHLLARLHSFLVTSKQASPFLETVLALYVSLHQCDTQRALLSLPETILRCKDNGTDCWLY